jgi:uncharacterized membrane protein YphA (DoxX/SURF4 family)
MQSVSFWTDQGHVTIWSMLASASGFLCGLLLLVGLLTRWMGTIATLGLVAVASDWLPVPEHPVFHEPISALFGAIMGAAIVLLGPGAFSLDARLFGPRRLVIPPPPAR